MERRISIPVTPETHLAAVWHRPAAAAGTLVVLCHGMLSSKDGPKHRELARRLCELGHDVVRFDFAGRGQSAGSLQQLTLTSQVQQYRAVLAWARTEARISRLGVIGSSLGAATALAGGGDPDCLVTMAAPARLSRLGTVLAGEQGLAGWRRRGWLEIEGERIGYALAEDAGRWDLRAAAAAVTCPWLLLHGEYDELIPVAEARLLQQSCPGARLEIIPSADHSFAQEQHFQQVVTRAAGFVHEQLSGSSGS